jgi:hypothetical protein
VGDSVVGAFDNVKVQNELPPITVSPATIETPKGIGTNVVTVSVPQLRSSTIAVTVTSQDPSVAIPQGAVNGVLTLQFVPGAANLQTFNVVGVGTGQTSFVFTNNQSVPIGNGVAVTVVNPTVTWVSDSFSGSQINSNLWAIDSTPLTDGGTLTAESSVFITNGTVEMAVTCEVADWPGFSMLMSTSFTASVLSPIIYELDRVKMEYQQVGGNTAQERTGVWVRDSGTNYVFFGDFDTHDGTAGGWQYNVAIGSTNDTPLPGGGVVLPSLGSAVLNDLGNHHIRLEVNGAVVQVFVDGIYGGSAPFPFSSGIRFGFGSFANYSNGAGNVVRGYYDNAIVSGPGSSGGTLGSLAVTKQANGTVVISWSGLGTLQSANALGGAWTDVSPPPTGTSYTVTPAAGAKQFFRLHQ